MWWEDGYEDGSRLLKCVFCFCFLCRKKKENKEQFERMKGARACLKKRQKKVPLGLGGVDQERRDEAERGGRWEVGEQTTDDRHLDSVCSSNVIIHSVYRD